MTNHPMWVIRQASAARKCHHYPRLDAFHRDHAGTHPAAGRVSHHAQKPRNIDQH
jgi:hypothetical protein